MKTINRYLILASIMLIPSVAGAQNMYDAIRFSQNEYFGTARSMGMGNAMTAVGGDLGSIGINPAGSAVANHGQFTITPGITISSVSSSYNPTGAGSALGSPSKTTSSRMTMPNFGVSMRFDTGNSTGLKSFTIGLVGNRTNQYEYSASASGMNSMSSQLAEFANAATGVPENVLSSYESYENSDVSWDVLTAYMGGMFGSYGQPGRYVGVTEALGPDGAYHYVPGPLSQASYVEESGSKTDFIMNLALNFSDKLYIGANIGTPFADYDYNESFIETALDPMLFPIQYDGGDGNIYETQFSSANTGYQYISRLDGIYAKLGVIYLPVKGLRIGAAIQTPTLYTVSERWQYSAATSFTDQYFNDAQSSPIGEYSYSMTSPYVFNIGMAYTFGVRGMFSLDYELTDYSVMSIYDPSMEDSWNLAASDPFIDYNMTNKYFAGVSHSLRAGVEWRLTPEFSVRAGYNVTTDPERYWVNNMGENVTADDYFAEFNEYYNHRKSLVSSQYYGDMTSSVSFGIGYSSPGSFFADFAVKKINYPDSEFSPYYDYDGFTAQGNPVFLESPKVTNKSSLLNMVLTLGWRF